MERKQEVQDEREVTPCDKMYINRNGLIQVVKTNKPGPLAEYLYCLCMVIWETAVGTEKCCLHMSLL